MEYMSNQSDEAMETEAAEDRRAEHECHMQDAELEAYYAEIDAKRPIEAVVPVTVQRRIEADERYTTGVLKSLASVMALFDRRAS